MIGTLDVKINAAHPNLPLTPFYTFVSSPSSVRVTNVPKKIGSWEITKVFVTANYPDNTSRSAECVNVAGCYVATLPLCNVVGESVNGFQITANGVDENGNAVTGYVLGHGDLIVLTRAGNITVGTTTWYFNFKDTQPTNPVKGDACIINGSLKWYNGTAWVDFGGLNLSDITLDLNADQATINEKLGEVIRRAGGTVIGCLAALFALSGMAAHVYPPNPDPSHKEFYGKMTRDSLVVTNAPDLVETDPTVPTQITNAVERGYLCTVSAAQAMTNGLDSSTFVPWVTDSEGNKTAVTIGSRGNGNVGKNSLVQGYDCVAKGYSTHAEGYSTHAEGDYTHAEGSSTHAEGSDTHAEGYSTHAEGSSTHAEGSSTHADGECTHAEGYYTHAEGYYTHAEGYYTHAEGFGTHAEGYYTHAEGGSTHAEGSSTHAEGYYTHAEGSRTYSGRTPTDEEAAEHQWASWLYGTAAHAAGWGAVASNQTAFTWQGTPQEKNAYSVPAESEKYYDHGAGTYNINPVGGLSGFYVGETNMATHIANATAGLINAPTATNILRSANAGVWDAALQVWWTPVMSNGKLTYQATTNVNINAGN